MSRYIGADKLMIKLSNVYVDLNTNMSSGEALAYLGAFILDTPTADVQKVRHARYAHLGGDEWCCTCCGDVVHTEGSWEKPTQKFCRECGAKMDEEEQK